MRVFWFAFFSSYKDFAQRLKYSKLLDTELHGTLPKNYVFHSITCEFIFITSFWFCKLKFTKLFSTQLLNKIGTIWRERHSSIFWWHICLINLFSNRMLISLFNMIAKHIPKKSTTVHILLQFFCITHVAKAAVAVYNTNPEAWDNLHQPEW